MARLPVKSDEPLQESQRVTSTKLLVEGLVAEVPQAAVAARLPAALTAGHPLQGRLQHLRERSRDPQRGARAAGDGVEQD